MLTRYHPAGAQARLVEVIQGSSQVEPSSPEVGQLVEGVAAPVRQRGKPQRCLTPTPHYRRGAHAGRPNWSGAIGSRVSPSMASTSASASAGAGATA